MTVSLAAEAPPIRRDEDGVLRVGDTRLVLDLVVNAFKDGATPEQISRSYRSLSLADAYAVISYYLRHRDDAEAYLARREASAADIRKQIESEQPHLAGLREKLLARRRE